MLMLIIANLNNSMVIVRLDDGDPNVGDDDEEFGEVVNPMIKMMEMFTSAHREYLVLNSKNLVTL